MTWLAIISCILVIAFLGYLIDHYLSEYKKDRLTYWNMRTMNLLRDLESVYKEDSSQEAIYKLKDRVFEELHRQSLLIRKSETFKSVRLDALDELKDQRNKYIDLLNRRLRELNRIPTLDCRV